MAATDCGSRLSDERLQTDFQVEDKTSNNDKCLNHTVSETNRSWSLSDGSDLSFILSV
jgi:hypothetical protein